MIGKNSKGMSEKNNNNNKKIDEIHEFSEHIKRQKMEAISTFMMKWDFQHFSNIVFIVYIHI